MFYCGSPVRSCWAELKYDRILAVGVGVLSYGFSKFRKTESTVFSARQVDRYDQPITNSLWKQELHIIGLFLRLMTKTVSLNQSERLLQQGDLRIWSKMNIEIWKVGGMNEYVFIVNRYLPNLILKLKATVRISLRDLIKSVSKWWRVHFGTVDTMIHIQGGKPFQEWWWRSFVRQIALLQVLQDNKYLTFTFALPSLPLSLPLSLSLSLPLSHSLPLKLTLSPSLSLSLSLSLSFPLSLLLSLSLSLSLSLPLPLSLSLSLGIMIWDTKTNSSEISRNVKIYFDLELGVTCWMFHSSYPHYNETESCEKQPTIFFTVVDGGGKKVYRVPQFNTWIKGWTQIASNVDNGHVLVWLRILIWCVWKVSLSHPLLYCFMSLHEDTGPLPCSQLPIHLAWFLSECIQLPACALKKITHRVPQLRLNGFSRLISLSAFAFSPRNTRPSH